jgi:hypothetical protein
MLEGIKGGEKYRPGKKISKSDLSADHHGVQGYSEYP